MLGVEVTSAEIKRAGLPVEVRCGASAWKGTRAENTEAGLPSVG